MTMSASSGSCHYSRKLRLEQLPDLRLKPSLHPIDAATVGSCR